MSTKIGAFFSQKFAVKYIFMIKKYAKSILYIKCEGALAVRASVVFLPGDTILSLTLPYWNSVDDLNYPLRKPIHEPTYLHL